MPQPPKTPHPSPTIDASIACAFFDGSAQAYPFIGAIGGYYILITLPPHPMLQIWGLWLIISKEKWFSHINIYEYYMLVNKCFNGIQSLHSYTM